MIHFDGLKYPPLVLLGFKHCVIWGMIWQTYNKWFCFMFNRKLFLNWIQNFVLFHVQKTRVLLLIKLKHLLWWSYRTESQSHDLSYTTSLIGVFPALKLCFLITNLLNIMSLWCLRNDKFSLKKQQVFSKISLSAKKQGP